MSADKARVGVPSAGRLRDDCLKLLSRAGFPTGMLHGAGSIAAVDGLEFIEMRPRDAGAAIAAGQLDAAFLATDIVMEYRLEQQPALSLGFSRSELVVASRDDDGRAELADLDGAVVATHLPELTRDFFSSRDVKVTVVAMGGSLEGVCAAGLADAIVDLRETGTSLMTNRLRVLEVIRACEALFVHRADLGSLVGVALRLEAVLTARRHRYVMLHVPAERLDDLRGVFPGLASPTVLPLAGREDLVAVHFVVAEADLWSRLSDLRAMGATGIVALEPHALLP
ncbi:MAG TPA: ATP phosphoribosyltransferase [Egibacteraceae bacterium]|nr:ATP phosphoribosyltransferase [Egibacteraceae bacterium]